MTEEDNEIYMNWYLRGREDEYDDRPKDTSISTTFLCFLTIFWFCLGTLAGIHYERSTRQNPSITTVD